jgi:hypothetical protein
MKESGNEDQKGGGRTKERAMMVLRPAWTMVAVVRCE